MNVNIKSPSLKIFTITYLINQSRNKILLLKSIPGKQLSESKWLGVGGKVEKGENLFDSAVREFQEETGLLIKDPVLRGTWIWFKEPNYFGILYIFFATKFTGKLILDSKEGKLEWHNLYSLENLEDLAPHQLHFLPKLLKDKNSFYSDLAVYSKLNKLKLKISNQ